MSAIHFIEHNGVAHEVEVTVGQSAMQAAIGNGVPGIDADCGGQCSCATCHVIVDEQWAARVGPAGELESSMLSLTPERTSHSRLACQIRLDASLDGLVVRIPEFQM